MLRGIDEHDLIASLEYQGKGTIQVDGQPCTLTKYRASTNYQTPASGFSTPARAPTDRPTRTIEVVSGQYAWNEDIAGRRDRPGEGQGHADAGGRAGAADPPVGQSAGRAQGRAARRRRKTVELGAEPGHAVSRTASTKAGRRPSSWEGGKPVVTFPIPGVPGATATATLDAKYMAERVVVKHGRHDHGVHLQRLPGLEQPAEQDRGVLRRQDDRAPERRGRPRPDDDGDGDGQRVCRGAGAGQREDGDQGRRRQLAHGPCCATIGPPADKSSPTPRWARNPDLTGNWAQRLDWQLAVRQPPLRSDAECRLLARPINQTDDFELDAPSRFGTGSSGLQAGALGQGSAARHVDEQVRPGHDLPAAGLPRQGPPRRIFQTDKDVTFLYRAGATAAADTASSASSRPTAASTTRRRRSTTTYYGLHRRPLGGRHAGARLHRVRRHDVAGARRLLPLRSDMHVVEKFTRQGNEILYDVTVEDPEVLVEPWVMTTRTCGAARIPTRACCRSAATARSTSWATSPRRFGTDPVAAGL